jgi:flagellar biosynthesis component FlhA
MVSSRGYKVPADYYIILSLCVIFIIIALFMDSPKQILDGFIKIQLSRSVLITDYMVLAGTSAALVNAAVLVIFMLILLIGGKCPANGKGCRALG